MSPPSPPYPYPPILLLSKPSAFPTQINFGIVYGMGAGLLQRKIGNITAAEVGGPPAGHGTHTCMHAHTQYGDLRSFTPGVGSHAPARS